MKIAICDDEPHFAKELTDHVNEYAVKYNVNFEVSQFSDVDTLNDCAKNFDIIFLDICFNGEEIGIEWAKKVRKQGIKTLIVICSSLASQVFNGYQADAIRFLLKPLKKSDFEDALTACIKKLYENNKQIIVKSDFDDVVIFVSQILYIESDLRHRIIYLENGSSVVTNESLKNLYAKLNEKLFKYPHKSYVVQLSKVQRIERACVKMINGKSIPLSRNLVTDFRNHVFNFMGEMQ
ncbi:MAG: LytTR family DNA-binding domain-containing protein [Oscillospiraceae bacterium]